MLQVTESRGVISIAQYDSNGKLCGETELDECAEGWYRQEMAIIAGYARYASPEFVARVQHNAAAMALYRMGVEV